MNNEKFPVLDEESRDAWIIGYAENAEEAEQIALENFLKDGSADDDELKAFRAKNTYYFRPLPINDSYDEIEDGELDQGYFGPA